MEKKWIFMIIVGLASIVLIILLIKINHKDRKGLFKKLPGDYSDPKIVESEFDRKD
jgi:hypothetical protein